MPTVQRIAIGVFLLWMLLLTTDTRAEIKPQSLVSAEPYKASKAHDLTALQRRTLAKSFLTRMKTGMNQADEYLRTAMPGAEEENLLPEGETLMIQPVLTPNLRIDGLIIGQVRNRKILLSVKDIATVLQFSITVDEKGEKAQGWYIRENKEFFIDLPGKIARTDHGTFKLSDNVISQDGDIYVPLSDLAEWLNFKIKPDISSQEIEITSDVPLPVQERYNRRKFLFVGEDIKEPVLPRQEEPYKAVDIPVIDVSTNSVYRKNNSDQEALSRHNVNLRTVGDLAYGTVTTQSLIDNENQLHNLRVNYKRESENPDLLGKLKARKFEVGDVSTTRVPIVGTVRQQLGTRVTNADSLHGFTRPSTVISGSAFPGWDVELYRDSQLVGFQEVTPDGIYQFDDVILYQSNNNFRLVFYGPQGETVEETVTIPVDSQRLSEMGGVYDVSLTFEDKQTYIKDTGFGNNPDKGSANIAALYEAPLVPGTAVSVGLLSTQQNETRDAALSLGASTVIAQTLVNATVAADDEADTSAELALRRSFGEHDFGNTTTWIAPEFDSQLEGQANQVGNLKNTLNMIGPLPFLTDLRPRYSLGSNYTLDTEGESAFNAPAGVSGAWKTFTLNQQLNYQDTTTGSEEQIGSLSNITGSYGRNRLRIGADYNIKPDSELRRVLANYRRYINKKLDFELDAERRLQQDLTEYSAKLDWQAGFMRISPRITYNSEHDFFAGLTTQSALLREPIKNDLKMYDRSIAANGMVSAHVFLDKNGSGIFDEGDEPLPEVVVKSLQNGGREQTDEKGIALFTSMRTMKPTDISLDPESLQDPLWVPGFDGVSILPREGYIAELEFPVHLSGELDGTVFIKDSDTSLRNIELALYNSKGNVQQSATTDPGGFYYFSHIPPGRYLLIIDEKSARSGNFIRPEPQEIEIGYEGTVIYGNNIFVEPGKGDIPSEILADMEDYKKQNPHIDFSEDNYDLVLNLGQYNSNLLMSLVWYKIRTRYEPIIANSKIFVPPAVSYPDIKTGKHTLRIGLKDETVEGAYNRCRALMARNLYCKVEIYPAYMSMMQAKAEIPLPEAPLLHQDATEEISAEPALEEMMELPSNVVTKAIVK